VSGAGVRNAEEANAYIEAQHLRCAYKEAAAAAERVWLSGLEPESGRRLPLKTGRAPASGPVRDSSFASRSTTRAYSTRAARSRRGLLGSGT
jgi:hypothetical protein